MSHRVLKKWLPVGKEGGPHPHGCGSQKVSEAKVETKGAL
jgi:hypothetical protein